MKMYGPIGISHVSIEHGGDVPDPTYVSNDPRPTFTSKNDRKRPTDEDVSDDVMFEDDNTIVGVTPILTSFNMLQKPSSSKPTYDFGLFSSSEESEEREDAEANKHPYPIVILE
ncbi:unnamed protein product [Lactuca saligna]|uniref:Uncharacterized protein n=1 Tax=Lactuca saligna TaxID=75948 RepID=A0AA36E6D3_LACSI|nr:unnamed protein product [Lactuca saligna]